LQNGKNPAPDFRHNLLAIARITRWTLDVFDPLLD